MAQVPYSPVPTIGPSGQGIAAPRVNTPLEAFGGATGAALSNMGRVVDKAGDEIFARALALQELDNRAAADNADTQYMIEAGKLHADFNSLEGKAAKDAYPDYVKNLQELRQKIGADLPNDMSRRVYDAASRATMGRTIFNGAGHAAAENKKYLSGTSAAKVAASRDFVMQNPNDEGAFEQGMRTIETQVRGSQAALEGWSPEKTDEEVRKNQSALIAYRVQGMAKTQPWTAKEYFEKNRGRMTAPDIVAVDKLVESSTRTAGSRIIADDVDKKFGTDPQSLTGSLEDRVAMAEREAERRAPDDPLMKDYARQQVIANYNRAKAVKRDVDIDNINTINSALTGLSTPGGKLPTTIAELTADPKVAAAWDQLEPTKQRSFLAGLAKNARGDVAWTTENQQRVLQLKGLAQADPLKFMETDIANENIPWSAKQALVNQQIKLKDKAEGDPRVTHALQTLRPQIDAAGLDSLKDRTRYLGFVGSLQDAMEQYQQENKKLPNNEEIRLMGSRLLQEQHTHWWQSSQKFFEKDIPDGAYNRIKNDPFWAERGVTPTDEDIKRIWVREQYQRLYGGKTKAEAKPQVPRE